MYNLPYHKENNAKTIREFMINNPFAFLIGCNVERFASTSQIPLFMEDRNDKMFLRGHFMKNTDHHKTFLENPNALAVFTGPHTYVSGAWYKNPYTPSTWNYMSVHVKGQLRFLNEDGLDDVLQKTSLHFENGNQESKTVYRNLPLELTQRLKKAVIAFDIEVSNVDTVFKLSQDRDFESYRNIIENLKEKGYNENCIAAEMEKREKELFSTSEHTSK